ncbi:four helix bundle protein [Candidatus Bipolaricaulota bacterium]|nr:four helix bundle protein [Candidatus Bipolaricaulota bacterium]
MGDGELKTHKDLDVWKEAMGLVKEVYLWTEALPREETYGLTAQMRRAAISIPSNILETQVFLARELFGLEEAPVCGRIEKLRKLLLGLIRALKAPEGGSP